MELSLFEEMKRKLLGVSLRPCLSTGPGSGTKGLGTYAAGTWGPLNADKLLIRNGHEWQVSGT